MRTLRKILTIFLCLMLCSGSCDWLFGEKEKEYDYIKVTIFFNVPVAINGRPAPNEVVEFTVEGNIKQKVITNASGHAIWDYEIDLYKDLDIMVNARLLYHDQQFPSGTIEADAELSWAEANLLATHDEDSPPTYNWGPLLIINITTE